MTLLSLVWLAADAGAELASHSQTVEGLGVLAIIRILLSYLSISAGLFFVFAGVLGVLRLPDFYTRLHAAGMTDTLGAELILLGLILQSGFTQLSLKLVMVAVFLFLTSPTATHAVSHTAYKAGLRPLLGKYRVPDPEDIVKRGKGAG